MRHKARSFSRLPGAEHAASLLAELSTAACPFSPVSADLPLALYGAGNLGRLARDILNAVGHDFVMVIDRNARRLANDRDWSGVALLEPQDVPAADRSRIRLAVSVVTSPYVPIERSLAELGFTDVVPFYDVVESFRHVHPLSNGWFASPLTAAEHASTADVLNRWDDDVSRAHHLQFLAWRRLREEWTFETAPVPACSRFFIPEVTATLHNNEIFLDAGAHHGSVSESFIAQTKGAFSHIVAIEPDATNREAMRKGLSSLRGRDSRMTILDCALADEEAHAIFHDGLGYASQLSPTGTTRVSTRRIDALGLSPTFIKLHLEGAELAALKGAKHTLLSNRPIVAVTVYHNADGIWRTPLWLMEALSDYRFLFRTHSWCGTGAVVYAIPNERSRSNTR